MTLVSQPATVPSLWLESCGDDLTPRPALPSDRQADVAIIGAGYTGLWTAHHLLRHDPSLRVVVIEREIAGWGASGRDGGWCSALFPTPHARLAREYGGPAARSLVRTLQRTVDEIGDWSSAARPTARSSPGWITHGSAGSRSPFDGWESAG